MKGFIYSIQPCLSKMYHTCPLGSGFCERWISQTSSPPTSLLPQPFLHREHHRAPAMENAKYLSWIGAMSSSGIAVRSWTLWCWAPVILKLSFKPKQAMIFQPASDHGFWCDVNTVLSIPRLSPNLKGFTWTWYYSWKFASQGTSDRVAVIKRTICLHELQVRHF